MSYVLFETLSAFAPVEEHRVLLAEILAHPMQDNAGIISAIRHTRWCIEVFHEASLVKRDAQP